MALCVGCNQVEADADRKYCFACFEMMIAPLKVGPMCAECFCPLDENKVIEKRYGGEPVCEVCYEMVSLVAGMGFFFNAQEEFEREQKKRKRNDD